MPLSSRNTRVRFLIQNQRAFIVLWLRLKFRIDDSFLSFFVLFLLPDYSCFLFIVPRCLIPLLLL